MNELQMCIVIYSTLGFIAGVCVATMFACAIIDKHTRRIQQHIERWRF